VWLFPHSAPTEGILLNEVTVKRKHSSHLQRKPRWFNLTYTGRSGKNWKWLQRKVSDVTYDANFSAGE